MPGRLRALLGQPNPEQAALWTPPSAAEPARRTAPPPPLDGYRQFVSDTAASAAQLAAQRHYALGLARPVTLSVVVPVYNPPPEYLVDCLSSVLAQSYPHWELCIADDASPDPRIKRLLREYAEADPRINVTWRVTNGHISAASNSALAIATGEYVALLDHDDMLPPDALHHVAQALLRRPATDMLYSDEDKIDIKNRRHDPFFKPDWSPESFLSRMYTCHLGVFRTELLRSIGGFRTALDGAQDYDLVLRVTEKTRQVLHLPRVLYHWREHQTSAAGSQQAKPYAYSASRRAIDEALARRGQAGHAEDTPGFPGIYRVRYALPAPPSVAIVVDTGVEAAQLERCLESVFTHTQQPAFEVVAVTHAATPEATLALVARATARWPGRVRSTEAATPSPARVHNAGAAATAAEVLCFLDGSVEVTDGAWLGRLVEQAMQRETGAVAPRVATPDGHVSHCGLALGIDGYVGRLMQGKPSGSSGHRGWGICTNNVAVVSSECMVLRRTVLEAQGGFDPMFRWQAHDADLCLRLLRAGQRNVLLGDVEVVLHRAPETAMDPIDGARLKSKWSAIFWRDPYFNPNFSLSSRWLEVARPGETAGLGWNPRAYALEDAGAT